MTPASLLALLAGNAKLATAVAATAAVTAGGGLAVASAVTFAVFESVCAPTTAVTCRHRSCDPTVCTSTHGYRDRRTRRSA